MRVTLPHDGGWTTVREHLLDRLSKLSAAELDAKLAAGDVAAPDGTPVTGSTPYVGGRVVFVRREFAPEPVVPFDIPVIEQDDRILVIDKPPFLATMPRGSHITQTAVARLRDELDLPLLSPAHRLDRLTSGVLVLTKHPRWRGPYQELFAARRAGKTYLALAPVLDGFDRPRDVHLHLVKVHGRHATTVEVGHPAPNAHTRIALVDQFVAGGPLGLYRLEPTTGRTHQLRATMSHLGAPIVGDPLYPVQQTVARDDFDHPLQLLAEQLTFVDPIDGTSRVLRSGRRLPIADAYHQATPPLGNGARSD
ncbi:tRNA pseudouridine32 synthase/23S rRNA pseudouridine746 synthase [Calidifontibacter indicus]|uniref:RNA pseudouridylate synthase n=2 Tax=Calidifontibacter indicus TaxID=419650 RepID=A0A3D9UZ25_9MICO|nr:tRNA pseudouridine32 synthase/23S rRNA pseudouridine746 synthase [Calidifontibacter indicus]